MNMESTKWEFRANTTTIVLLTIAMLQGSCNGNRKQESAVKIVREWMGKEVKFPKDLSCTSMGNDTASCIDLYNDNYKILLYVDSLGCTSCRLQ